MIEQYMKNFEGYEQVLKEREVFRKYGVDYSLDRGLAKEMIERYHPSCIRYIVSDVFDETPSTKTFRLVSANSYLPPFQAGQYISLKVTTGNISTNRPYSISSPPNQTGFYDITVRRVPGGLVSSYLHDKVKPGEVLEGAGPAGNFYYNPLFHDRSMVLLAGGCGITPFMSMIQEIIDCGLEREVCLFYGCRNLSEAVFHNRLQHLSERYSNFNYFQVLEEPPENYECEAGLITGKFIKDSLGDLAGRTFFISGPREMHEYCSSVLSGLGIPWRKIRKEAQGPLIKVTEQPGWPEDLSPDREFKVHIAGGRTVSAPAGEPLLKTLENEGIALPSRCRSGECSMCRIKLLKGRVFQPHGTPVRRSDAENGYIHSCVSYPLEDLEVLV